MPDLSLVIGNKNYSSWSLRAWLILKQTGEPFQEIRIPLDTPTTHAAIARYSPSGRVPVLLHGSTVIWDSLAIAEYLAECFPSARLWPLDPMARAYARSVSAEMHSGFAKLRTHMPMDLRSTYPETGRAPGVQADIDRILQIWQDCRERFGQAGVFLLGSFSIADAMYAPVVSRFRTYGVILPPLQQAYAEQIWALNSMQAWQADAISETEIILNP